MKRRRIPIVLFVMILIAVELCACTPAGKAKVHKIPLGESKAGNPLKGLIPFQGSTTDFPYSMEWFCLPVSAVQVGMNDFDWSALEEKLNAIAARGHQAVFRFYYDYPGLDTGVPRFLIENGLEMKPYDEPESLGGSGFCPDYSDENLRGSMKNFISALGENYDGDARIGFITEGLLGFWGEWHDWPFDEDSADGKPDWSISPEIYWEVLTAYENAFTVTPLCVREPKPGLDFAKFDVGYHDDSFAYATLKIQSGGQPWSFGQKLANFGEADKWKTNCIGGEVYPPIQTWIFKEESEYPDGFEEGYQDWNACVKEIHPTWLICDKIELYQEDERVRAIEASKGMGYDFQVISASFGEWVGDNTPLPLEVTLKNIGIAPFYYDHTKWPVMIGVKQSEELVASWNTEWDLSAIPADASEVTFHYSVEMQKLVEGQYTVCIKASNPLQNGALLWFANEGQAEDGWLVLGNFVKKCH